MTNFFLYFYYRTYQLYNGSLRAAGPVAFVIAFDFSFIVNAFLRLLALSGLASGLEPLSLTCIPIDAAILLVIGVITIPILIALQRKSIHEKMDDFKKETPDERRSHGKNLILYIVVSILLLAITFII